MGIEEVGQVCVMIHSGSRGFGHQVATGNQIIQHIFFSNFAKDFSFLLTIRCRCPGANGKSYEKGQHRNK